MHSEGLGATEDDAEQCLEVWIPLCTPLPSFEFRLLPPDCDQCRQHAYLVYHGLCEVFFDLTLYPCALELIVTGRGFMVQESANVMLATDALDAWERVQEALGTQWCHSCWLSVECRG